MNPFCVAKVTGKSQRSNWLTPEGPEFHNNHYQLSDFFHISISDLFLKGFIFK